MVRSFFNARWKGSRVTQGRGTGSTWLRVRLPPGKAVTSAEATALRSMGVTVNPGNTDISLSPQDTYKFVQNVGVISSSPRRIAKAPTAASKFVPRRRPATDPPTPIKKFSPRRNRGFN